MAETDAAIAHIVVVGLGPGGPDLITAGTLAAIEGCPNRFVRTTRHPAASVLADATSFDHVYDEADDLDEVYPRIVALLIDEANEHGDVLYAVPGSPLVAERTVELLVAAAAAPEPRCRVTVLPALSFLDLTWVRLGIDPVAVGVRVIDGQRFATEAAGERGPLLVSQCDSAAVLSDIKLLLDDGRTPSLEPDATVTVLQRLGLPDESVFDVGWLDLDRGIDADHLTSLYIPNLAVPVARQVERFVELVATLRRECPWDREQTHQSLRRHLLEETYEVLEAIDGLDVETGEGYAELEEELGDLLFQIVFHATLAIEAGQFTLADVAETVHDKLRDRHPHVFAASIEIEGADDSPERRGADDSPERRGADDSTATVDDLVVSWEQQKKVEKDRDSVFDGLPKDLPALAYAAKVRKKAVTLADSGVAVPPLPGQSADALTVEPLTVEPLTVEPLTEDALAERLFVLVDQARHVGLDPESALRAAARRYERAARAAEQAGDPER